MTKKLINLAAIAMVTTLGTLTICDANAQTRPASQLTNTFTGASRAVPSPKAPTPSPSKIAPQSSLTPSTYNPKPLPTGADATFAKANNITNPRGGSFTSQHDLRSEIANFKSRQAAMTSFNNASADIKSAQKSNLNRFYKKKPNNVSNKTYRKLPNNGAELEYTSPSKSKGYSKTYQKKVDANGETILYKDQDGRILGKVRKVTNKPNGKKPDIKHN